MQGGMEGRTRGGGTRERLSRERVQERDCQEGGHKREVVKKEGPRERLSLASERRVDECLNCFAVGCLVKVIAMVCWRLRPDDCRAKCLLQNKPS